MALRALKHVKGSELPSSLLEKMEASVDTTFTIIPEVDFDDKKKENEFSLKMAMRGMENESTDYSLSDIIETWQ